MSAPDIPAIVRRGAADLLRLLRLGVATVQERIKLLLRRLGSSAAVGGGGLALGFAGLLFILGAIAAGLATVLPIWASLLAVGSVAGVGGALLVRGAVVRASATMQDALPEPTYGLVPDRLPGGWDPSRSYELIRHDLVRDVESLRYEAAGVLRRITIAASLGLVVLASLRIFRRSSSADEQGEN
jgi:hypothetical protein